MSPKLPLFDILKHRLQFDKGAIILITGKVATLHVSSLSAEGACNISIMFTSCYSFICGQAEYTITAEISVSIGTYYIDRHV